MEFLLDFFSGGGTSAIAGGLGAITGIIGNWLVKREERKTLIIQFDQQHKMAKLNGEQQLQLASSERQTLSVKGNIAVESTEADAFKDSLAVSAKSVGVGFVDGIRGLMRPLITVFLLVMCTLLAVNIHELVGGLESLSGDSIFQLYRDIILQLLFLTCTAVTWWFGSRPSKQRRLDLLPATV